VVLNVPWPPVESVTQLIANDWLPDEYVIPAVSPPDPVLMHERLVEFEPLSWRSNSETPCAYEYRSVPDEFWEVAPGTTAFIDL
jgi:hypothetical protein